MNKLKSLNDELFSGFGEFELKDPSRVFGGEGTTSTGNNCTKDADNCTNSEDSGSCRDGDKDDASGNEDDAGASIAVLSF